MNGLPRRIVESPIQEQEPRQSLASWYTPGLSDGLGDRLLMFDNTTASSLELLRFRREFADAPGFEAALRHRVDELADVTHPGLARIRAVEWLGEGDGLALVSNHTVGRRLSEILSDARGPKFATELIRQLAPVLAALQQRHRGISHGALSPDRVVVTPDGRLILVEHVVGSAIESLRLPAWRLRFELGLAVPLAGSSAVLDSRQDVVQLAYMALSLLMGRRVDPADGPEHLQQMLDEVDRTTSGQPASPMYLRRWLERALQVHVARFRSAEDASLALEEWPDSAELEPQRSPLPLEVHMAAEPADALPVKPPTDDLEDISGFPAETELEPEVGSSSDVLFARLKKVAPISRPTGLADRRQGRALPDPAEGGERPRVPAYQPAYQQVPQPPAFSPARAAVQSAGSRQNPVKNLPAAIRWALVSLSVICLAEAAVIAGLIYTRPAASPDSTAAAAPAAGAAGQPSRTAATAPAAPASQPAGAALSQGRLEISSDPTGARVLIDGAARGTTPLSVAVAPGNHTVVITGGGGSTRRTVNVTAGGTSSLMASLAPAGAAGGWVSFNVPLELQVAEGGRLLGTTKAERIMLPAGSHQLQLSNAAAGFQHSLTVEIEPGRTVSPTVAIPNGTLSLNALPWANVWLDGQALGTTPFANLAVPIGTHEVVWRHPQHGERRQSVVVTAKAPVRLVMDLNK
jgi:hypothetical protein